MARINHDRAIKARVDAVVTGFFISLIEMHPNIVSGYIYSAVPIWLRGSVCRRISSILGELDYKRGPALDVSAKETEKSFHVVDVVGADGELAVNDLVKLSSSDNHMFKRKISILGLRWRTSTKSNSKILNRKFEKFSFGFSPHGNII